VPCQLQSIPSLQPDTEIHQHRIVTTPDRSPAQIVRRPKRAFASDVVDRWYRDSLSGKLRDTLLADDALVYRFLRPERVRRLVADHHAGRRNHHKVIFSIVVLEEWLRRTGAILSIWCLSASDSLAAAVSAAV
jgi:hypothetical protein